MITHHTTLLQTLIDKHNLKSYLEIGVNVRANNFDKIDIYCKIGVDPNSTENGIIRATSDEFFEAAWDIKKPWPFARLLTPVDLIFIDGDHTADQVKRDFENSLRCLSDNGFIVIHDCLPTDEITTCIPRGSQKIWHGDVYKFCMVINYYALKVRTYNIDEGCMVIQKLPGITPNCILPSHRMDKAIKAVTWEQYLNGRKIIMVIQNEVNI